MGNNIKKIEKELSDLVQQDKQAWTHFYVLLKEIEDQELWRNADCKSFTSWVKNFSVQNKIHESVVWNRKKAGKVYENYVQIKKNEGIEVAKLEDLNITADSLVLLDKIAKESPVLGAELTDKVVSGELKRKELREAYKAIRDPNKIKSKKKKDEELIEVAKIEDRVTSAQIVEALKDELWLGKSKETVHFYSTFMKNKYKPLTEFPVFPGTSTKSRRIDVLVAENLTTIEARDLFLHGIEIKVSSGDLKADKKYSEYTEFVDYMWLAVPNELIEVAKEVKFNDCGIISIKDGQATVIEQAKRLNPALRHETLVTLSLKLL